MINTLNLTSKHLLNCTSVQHQLFISFELPFPPSAFWFTRKNVGRTDAIRSKKMSSVLSRVRPQEVLSLSGVAI